MWNVKSMCSLACMFLLAVPAAAFVPAATTNVQLRGGPVVRVSMCRDEGGKQDARNKPDEAGPLLKVCVCACARTVQCARFARVLFCIFLRERVFFTSMSARMHAYKSHDCIHPNAGSVECCRSTGQHSCYCQGITMKIVCVSYVCASRVHFVYENVPVCVCVCVVCVCVCVRVCVCVCVSRLFVYVCVYVCTPIDNVAGSALELSLGLKQIFLVCGLLRFGFIGLSDFSDSSVKILAFGAQNITKEPH